MEYTGNAQVDTVERGNTNTLSPRHRRICFTLYTDTINEILLARISILLTQKYKGSKYCMGIEQCPDTDRTHVQGYFEYKNPINWKRWFNEQGYYPHIEVSKGTREENFDYCTKDGLFHTKIRHEKPTIMNPI